MKKIIRKLKGKKVLSFVLAAIMLATTFNMALPMLKLDASAADIEINGVSQTKIVSDRTVYEKYAAEFLNGYSEPTNIVIPGLDVGDDYVTQGMAYYPQKDWMLITAYHGNCDSTKENPLPAKPSMVFCIDAKTGEFVAMFSFLNVPDANGNRTANTDHGGGIAISENNIYYACGDKDRKIAYAPLSAIKGIENEADKYREVELVAEQDFYEIGSETKNGKTAYTAYVCYDEGILWTGNFYDRGAVAGFVAADYNAPANAAANSMVWGYKLSGSTPAEEWANLVGAKGKDCQGNPSYVIALHNEIQDVQYAVVDNGKIYVSQSYGTGKGTTSASSLGGMDDYSHLSVADIDLSVPGTKEITFKVDAAGKTRTVKDAYHINWYQKFDFMPMSEGLCVINDYVFMTFESACNKYLNKAGVMGNCEMPVDVVWKMDQHALMKEERPAECQSMYYEKVTSLAQIEDSEEYMILYESPEKDPITQNKYLYALSANGGFYDYKLAKRYSTGSEGYAGAVGHAIKDYKIEGNKLYLYDANNDDLVENRWTITGVNTGNLRIKNASTYFSNYKNFYFNKDVIAMTNDASADLNNMGIMEAGNGSFYLYYDTTPGAEGGETYLWCNDFSVAGYEGAVNDWYGKQTDKMYSGLTETKGTFHTDGLGTTNVIGQSVGANVYLGQLHIYKRVPDYYSSTVENRVYTDLDAELQADGTYNIMMETYATDPTQYQIVDERPTDFIFVVDASSSMNKDDVVEYTYTKTEGVKWNHIDDSSNEWYVYFEGEYCRLEHHKNGSDPEYIYNIFTGKDVFVRHKHNYHCVTFRTSDNRKFHLTPNGFVDTTQQGDGPADRPDKGQENICRLTNVGINAGEGNEVHQVCDIYERKAKTRLETTKTALNNLIDNIATLDGDNRMAVVQFGSNADENWVSTGMYNTNGTSFIQYSGDGSITNEDYQKAFYSKSSADTVKQIINNITPTDDGNVDSDTYVNYGFDIARNIINNSDANYITTKDMTVGSNRNVCVIMITDGIPGKGGSDTSSATTVANSTIQIAKELKKKGAYVYTVQLGNNSMDGFNMYNYLEYVSSNYLVSENMTTPGSKNTDKIDYHYDLNLSSFTSEDVLSKTLMDSIRDNNTNATAILGPNSVIYQQLTDAFIIPADAQMTTELVNGWYDAIGRLTFDENGTTAPSTITSTLKNTQRHLYVKGYDYSSRYIGNKKPGEKLRVTITGVLANANSDKIENTSISDTTTTAVWESTEHNVPFKYFPYKAFSIPEYTYALDYGLDMLDTNVNGTLCAVSNAPTKQNVADYEAKKEYTQKSANGLVKITDNSLDLLYHTTPTNMNDSGYVLIKRPTEEGEKAKYDWFEIKVVPASNVYFEEEDMTVNPLDVNDDKRVAWTTYTDGSAINTYRPLTEEGDIVGFENAYNVADAQCSNGTAKKVTVTSTKRNSKAQTFDFVGTGFDLVSRCDDTTGMMLVNVKKVVTDTDGNTKLTPVTASLVDTYCAEGPFNQTPVFSWSGAHGTYNVEITAIYLSNAGALNATSTTNSTTKGIKNNLIDTGLEFNTSTDFDSDVLQAMLDEAGVEDVSAKDVELIWFDDNSIFNGGTGVAATTKGSRALTDDAGNPVLVNYIDGFRVYNPLGTDPDAYTESNISYANVIDNLAALENPEKPENINGIAFITGLGDDVTSLSFAQYKQSGPKGELYLKAGKAISFKFDRGTNEKIMLGLRAVNGATKINVNGHDISINSATEMYYDISHCISETDEVTITVNNAGSNIVAINHIKFSGGDASDSAVINPRSMARSADATAATTNKFLPLTQEDLVAIESVMNAEPIPTVVKNGVVIPLVEEEEEIPEDNTNTDNDNTNDDTNTEESENEEFSLFSLIEMLIAFIEKILYNAFGAGSIA